MKRIILLGALLAPFFVSGQSIFDITQSQATTLENEWIYTHDGQVVSVPLFYTARLKDDFNDDQQVLRDSNNDTLVVTREESDVTYFTTGKVDRIYLYTEWHFFDPTSGAEYGHGSKDYWAKPTGSLVATDKCEESTSGNSFSYMHEGRCYAPAWIKANDSCSDSSETYASTESDPTYACITKADDSKCLAVNTSDSNGNTFYETQQDNLCYEIDTYDPLEVNQNVEPVDDVCVQAASGDSMMICNDNPDSDNGYDKNKYCGTVNLGNGDTAVCYDKDNDGDTIPNHKDDDIDGDGVLNPDDPDAYGDGTDTSSGSGGGSGGGEGGGTGDGTGTNENPTDMTGTNLRLDELINEQKNTSANQQATTTAIENMTEILDDQRNGIGALNDGVGNIAGILEGGDGVSFDPEPSDNLTGFYESEYPDGFEGVWADKKPLFEQTPVVAWVNSWKITVSGSYTFPEWCIDVIHNFGCHSFNIDPRVFPFIRIIIIITSLMYARRLVTGG